MRVTVTHLVTHLCPYKDERDLGQLTASWEGKRVELHGFAQSLAIYADKNMTHEAMTEEVRYWITMHGGVDATVTTTWNTAGMEVTVTA